MNPAWESFPCLYLNHQKWIENAVKPSTRKTSLFLNRAVVADIKNCRKTCFGRVICRFLLAIRRLV
ncbi:MAG TPA: hypothetical protein DCG12_05440 [Planctomycetaceae bacterium]|nr:hypothetical protein [Planctomycetaceae bacterium]